MTQKKLHDLEESFFQRSMVYRQTIEALETKIECQDRHEQNLEAYKQVYLVYQDRHEQNLEAYKQVYRFS